MEGHNGQGAYMDEIANFTVPGQRCNGCAGPTTTKYGYRAHPGRIIAQFSFHDLDKCQDPTVRKV